MLRMKIKHEIADRAFEPCQRRFEERESRAGNPGGAFEIHQAQGFAEIEMLFRRIQAGGRTPAARLNFDIAGLVDAVGHLAGGKIGQFREAPAQFLLQQALFSSPS